jgi:hypothetical protein
MVQLQVQMVEETKVEEVVALLLQEILTCLVPQVE